MEAQDASAVLRVVSPTRPKAAETEDQDLILARALQEQEHAYFMLQSGQYGGEQYGGEHSDGFDFEDEAAPGEGGEPAAPAAGEGSACAAGAQEGAEGMEAEAGEEEELDDEALARRLHQEEQRALYQRMLEMSGYTAHQEGAADELDVDAMSYEDLQALGDVAGTVSRGLAAHSIQTLPQASFKQLASARRRGSCGGEPPAAAAGATAAGEGEGAGAQLVATNLQRCTICLADFEEEDVLKVLPCKHAYHAGCLDSWLGVSKACPVCNAEVAAAANAAD